MFGNSKGDYFMVFGNFRLEFFLHPTQAADARPNRPARAPNGAVALIPTPVRAEPRLADENRVEANPVPAAA